MSDTTTADADCSEMLVDAIGEARKTGVARYIVGGNTKRYLLGRDCAAEPLDISPHRGIVDYQPGELVITARGGTPLADLDRTLAEEGQCLPFEPPLFGGRATIGGTIACNLSGPGRPWRGAARDHVLGAQLVSGKGQRLQFGGTVMKNVAGYDLSRLQAGALGTLGILSEVSIKVIPRPEQTLTLHYEMDATEAIKTMNQRAGEPRPLTGAFWSDGLLHLRLAGAASAVQHTAQLWGGEQLGNDDTTWRALREFELPFFHTDKPLWRLSVGANTPITTGEDTLVDWGGAQRWLRGKHSVHDMNQVAKRGGGHATLFRGGDRAGEVRAALTPVEQTLQQRLKQAFDPDGILNPGRLYSGM